MAPVIPKIIVGTSRMGRVLPLPFSLANDRHPAFEHLDQLLEIGCSAFDLAASYQLGGTERFFGSWMVSRRHRDRLFLISKGAHPYPLVRPSRLNAKDIAADLHASLRRLLTDRLDLYFIHKDDPAAPLEPVLESLTSFQRQGKILAWGVSNWGHARIAALDALARATGVPTVAASSPHFSLVDWSRAPWKGSVSIAGDANRAAREYYQGVQLPVFAWSPLGAGFFSPQAKRSSLRYYGTPANLARKERAAVLARKYGVTPVQIALAYLFSQRFPVYAVVAATTVEKMRTNLGATSLRLEETEVRWLESPESEEKVELYGNSYQTTSV